MACIIGIERSNDVAGAEGLGVESDAWFMTRPSESATSLEYLKPAMLLRFAILSYTTSTPRHNC